MPTFAELKPSLTLASNGACSDDKLMPIFSRAQETLMSRGYWVGMFADLKIQTFDGNFNLPYGYQRAVQVYQNMSDGSINQAWCAIENDSMLLNPDQFGDGELIPLGDGPLDRSLLTPSVLGVRPDAVEDNGVNVVISGLTNQGNQVVYNSEITQDILIVNGGYNDGASVYGEVLSITKPVTNGPIRIYAYQGAVRYLVCTMQPQETEAKRRRYRFPEVAINRIPVASIVYNVDNAEIDTGLPAVSACEGQSIYITGFCPGYINGLWTISEINGGIITINGSFSGVEGAKTEIIGGMNTVACLTVTALKRPVPITEPNQQTIIQNSMALQLATMAMFKWNAQDLPQYEKLLDDAQKILTDESTRYGQDPTKTLERKANYRYDLNRYPPGSLGNTRGRLALDLPGGLRTGKTDLNRLINEAVEEVLSTGKYGYGVRQTEYTVNADSAIVLLPDENSLLTASICGIPLALEDMYYPSARPSGGLWYGNWTGYGGFYPNAAGPGVYGNQGSCTYKAIDYGFQERYDGRRAYDIQPCSVGKCVSATVQLKWVPIDQDAKIMPEVNYVALKLLVECYIAKRAGDLNTYNSLHGRAFALLDKEKKQHRGGARALPRFNSGMKRQIGMGMR